MVSGAREQRVGDERSTPETLILPICCTALLCCCSCEDGALGVGKVRWVTLILWCFLLQKRRMKVERVWMGELWGIEGNRGTCCSVFTLGSVRRLFISLLLAIRACFFTLGQHRDTPLSYTTTAIPQPCPTFPPSPSSSRPTRVHLHSLGGPHQDPRS